MHTTDQLLASMQLLSNEVLLLRAAIQQSGDLALRDTLEVIDVLAALDASLVDGSIWPEPEKFSVAPGGKWHLTRTLPVDQHLVLTRIEQPGLGIRVSRSGHVDFWGHDSLVTFLWVAPGDCLTLIFSNYGPEPVEADLARIFGFTVLR